MATYTILPSSFTAGSGTVSNPDRAYTDTSSSTYASVTVPNAGNMYLGGFDFSTIPSGYIISAITVKIKWRKNSGQADYYAKLIGKSSGTDVALSSDLTSQYPAATSTFTLTGSAATVASYASTLAINFRSSSGSPQGRIYGVEVIVTADKPPVNKVIYGGNTLIDLTSDTVTAADVASGKTFHLANGAQATGTASGGGTMSSKSSTGSSFDGLSLSFTNLSREPSWFAVVITSNDHYDAYISNLFVCSIVYDGATTQGYFYVAGGNRGEAGGIYEVDVTVAYSNGTLTLSNPNVEGTDVYFFDATYTLYYM